MYFRNIFFLHGLLYLFSAFAKGFQCPGGVIFSKIYRYSENNTVVKDIRGLPIHTLQDYLEGKSSYVTVAVDIKLLRNVSYGTPVCIPTVNKLLGRTIKFQITDTHVDLYGLGWNKIAVAVRDKSNSLFNGTVTSIRIPQQLLSNSIHEDNDDSDESLTELKYEGLREDYNSRAGLGNNSSSSRRYYYYYPYPTTTTTTTAAPPYYPYPYYPYPYPQPPPPTTTNPPAPPSYYYPPYPYYYYPPPPDATTTTTTAPPPYPYYYYPSAAGYYQKPSNGMYGYSYMQAGKEQPPPPTPNYKPLPVVNTTPAPATTAASPIYYYYYGDNSNSNSGSYK